MTELEKHHARKRAVNRTRDLYEVLRALIDDSPLGEHHCDNPDCAIDRAQKLLDEIDGKHLN